MHQTPPPTKHTPPATMKNLTYTDLEALTNGFSADALIGKGSHGKVYKATLQNGLQVAVKKPTTTDHSKLVDEVNILTAVRSPHVVNLLTTVGGGDGQGILLVMELMPNGSLYDLLHMSPGKLSWSGRVRVAVQVARALMALHEAGPPVVHRDVKSLNVLMDLNGDASLADFSLAVRDGSPDCAPAGTIGYLDPCYTRPEDLDVRNDIFSYGVLLLELISGRRAIDTTHDTTSILTWALRQVNAGQLSNLLDPNVPPPCKLKHTLISLLITIASRCVSLDKDQRPSAREIMFELHNAVGGFGGPVWCRVKVEVFRRFEECVRVWRMRRKRRVIAASSVVCEKKNLGWQLGSLLGSDQEG